jgi:hypothetical protein
MASARRVVMGAVGMLDMVVMAGRGVERGRVAWCPPSRVSVELGDASGKDLRRRSVDTDSAQDHPDLHRLDPGLDGTSPEHRRGSLPHGMERGHDNHLIRSSWFWLSAGRWNPHNRFCRD